MIRLGEESARRTVVYIGTHHGTEEICAEVLLRFLEEYCLCKQEKRRLYQINMEYLFRSRLLCVIPMLNPDGVDLRHYGADGWVNKRQLLLMNRNSADFSAWQANGRGVDIHHNYSVGFAEYKEIERSCGIRGGSAARYGGEYPESEPESRALAAYLRLDPSVRMILSLHAGEDRICASSGGQWLPHSRETAQLLAEMHGCAVSEPLGAESCGTLGDFSIRELHCPCFTLGCSGEDTASVYGHMREMLFTAPLLI